MTKYAVSLAGKQYTVILVTPEDNLSIIGHTKYGWSHLLFPAGYNSDEISLDDLIASCSASFRFYLPNEVYYFPAWIIDSLEIQTNLVGQKLLASSFGSEFLEWVAENLSYACKTNYIYVKVPSESVRTLLVENSLWEEQDDISEGNIPIYKKSKLGDFQRQKLSKNILGITSLSEEIQEELVCSLVKESIVCNPNHAYSVNFNVVEKDGGIVLASSIRIYVSSALSEDGILTYTVSYTPVMDDTFFIVSAADNYAVFVKTSLETVADFYRSPGARVIINDNSPKQD